MEQSEYKAENIDVAHVDFVDNQECLDLIERKPLGILNMTDEEIRIPKGSDHTLLTRLDKEFASHKYYLKRKLGHPVFTVEHYAGQVSYLIEGFLEKNKDLLENDISNVIMSSSDPIISSLLKPKEDEEEKKQAARPGVKGKSEQQRTLGSQFRSQLHTLMDTLNATNPHFIRCIKPNAQKCADLFDSQMVARQLRYLGIQEVVKIRQLGYPVRSSHEQFFKRFRILAPQTFLSNVSHLICRKLQGFISRIIKASQF